MLKLIGGILLLVACFGVSHYFSGLGQKRMSYVRELISLIKYIRDNIDCYSMPIDKILESCRGDILYNLGIEKKISDLSELYDELKKSFDGECIKILYTLARDFGKGYREHQMKICDTAVLALERHLETLEIAYPAHKRRIATLCFSIGGMLLIALL